MVPTRPINYPSLRRPSLASRRLAAWLSVVVSLGLLSVAAGVGVCQAGNGLPWFYFLGSLKIGPFPSQRICRDDLGSCHYEHGPKCLPHPVGANCAPTGPGFGVFGDIINYPACLTTGMCTDLCSIDCVSEGYVRGYYFVVVNADGTLALAGPYSKRTCERLSDECLSIGALPNTEGSKGGP